MLLLLRTRAGLALFKVLEEERVSETEELAGEFEPVRKFVSTAEALRSATSLVKSKRHKGLRLFLKAHCDGDTLGVADSELCDAIRNSTKIECVCNGAVEELMRGALSQLTELVSGLAGQADTMIIQAIGMLDDRDRELNAHAKWVREWYGFHFPELDKIVQDNVCYAKTVKLMGSRSNAAKLDFSEILPAESKAELKEAAVISTGTEISELDLINIREICDQVLSLSEYRSRLHDLLKGRMNTVAPNLTALVGELVGARLIAHAGSITNLAKKPGIKIQILGAGKYGIICHAPLISQATQGNMKGKIARALAAKTALAVRIDACGDNSFGVENLAKVEAMLSNAEGRGQGDKSTKSKPLVGVYVKDLRMTKKGAIIKTFNRSAEPAYGPALSDAANAEDHVTQAAKEEEENSKEKKKKAEVTSPSADGNGSADGKEAEAGQKKQKKKRKHEEETEQPNKKERKRLRALARRNIAQPARNREWREIRWSAPAPGWVKINTDGSALGYPGVAGAGCVLRDDRGGWLGGFVHKVGFASAMEVEMWGALVGLQMTWDKGHRRVVLETDSDNLRRLLLSSDRKHLTSNEPVLEAIRAMLAKDWEVEITHIYREGNMCADWMASRGTELPHGSRFYDSPPSDILLLLTRYLNGVSIPRYCPI